MIRDTYLAQLQHNNIQVQNQDICFGVVRRPMYGIEKLVDRNIPSLAPPQHLLDLYKKIKKQKGTETAWEKTKYKQRYLESLSINDLTNIKNKSKNIQGDLYLVCYCGDRKYCHRRLLKEKLDQI